MKVMLVIDVDFVSLVYIGSPSPRFVVLFGADGMSSPPSGIGVSFRLVVAVILWLLACAFLLSRIPPILRLVLSMKLALLTLLLVLRLSTCATVVAGPWLGLLLVSGLR